jgi:hypothetical protein
MFGASTDSSSCRFVSPIKLSGKLYRAYGTGANIWLGDLAHQIAEIDSSFAYPKELAKIRRITAFGDFIILEGTEWNF